MIKTFKYPPAAVKKEIQGTVVVQFIVDAKGNVSDIKAISGPRMYGLREECVRVIKQSGKWMPAQEKGRVVNCYKRQPIIFRLSA